MNIIKHYIDKDTVKAEIENRIKEIDEIGTYLSPKGVLTNLLCHLNTLEVKEVDLEKELENWLGERVGKWTGVECERMCRYFYELGIKAQKGE